MRFPDPLAIPRCSCSHTIYHHVRNGQLVSCQHPSCEECEGWCEAG